jgi:eukaryotic-like serine/threonine-protein kinase
MPGIEGLPSALADRYRIERELGAGGMATVYLARDIRHDRSVAIKVLHPDLAAALGAERFLAEIKTTANLQHPHILPLHDSGVADGFLFYVMPFVDGETLRDRLTRERQLPVDDALTIAREVADALQYAHQRGIIHRDIKPENILLQGGHALVADFGIALAVQQAGGVRMTQTGLSLGTPQYMSPEQAMGERTLDARTDIYALGAVTYEMLAGDAPFTGSSVQAIVARVLTERPSSITTVRDTVPPGVEHAVMRALAKLPADRWTSAADFAAALRSDAPAATAQFRTPAHHTSLPRLTAALGVLSLLLLGTTVFALNRHTSSSLPVVFDAALPDSALMSSVPDIGATGYGTPSVNLSVSPHGDYAVYVARHGDSTALWYRSLIDASSHPIIGTTGGTSPRISPDGSWLAFTAANRTMIVPAQGGDPRQLLRTDVPPSTLEWVSPRRLMAITNDGRVVNWLDPEVGATDANSTKVVLARPCLFARWIESQGGLLCNTQQSAELNPKAGKRSLIRARNADGSPGAPVLGSAFQVVDDRYILYVSADGELRAAPYDPSTGLAGRSVSLISGISLDAAGDEAQLELAPNGMLGFTPRVGDGNQQMVALHAGGAPKQLPIEHARFQRFDVMKDGSHMAAAVITPEGQELRIYDLRTGQRQTWLHAQYIGDPYWTGHGDQILVRVWDGTRAAILLGSPSAATAPDTLYSNADQARVPTPLDYHDDGTVLARTGATPYSLLRFDLTTRPLRFDTLVTDATFAARSPDNKHLVWQSSQGTGQLNLTTYPVGAQHQLIAEGGVEPLWLSSTELLFRTGLTWKIVHIDPSTGQLVGLPKLWGSDSRFLDTPNWSNKASQDGGIVYVQSQEISDARFLRFIPNFVARMKTAVDQANR